MTTIVIQTRVDEAIAKLIDERVTATGSDRAKVVRSLVEAALAAPEPASGTATDSLLDRVADEVGALAARIDAVMDASRAAERHAFAAYAASRLHALMALPQHQQEPFVQKLAGRPQS